MPIDFQLEERSVRTLDRSANAGNYLSYSSKYGSIPTLLHRALARFANKGLMGETNASSWATVPYPLQCSAHQKCVGFTVIHYATIMAVFFPFHQLVVPLHQGWQSQTDKVGMGKILKSGWWYNEYYKQINSYSQLYDLLPSYPDHELHENLMKSNIEWWLKVGQNCGTRGLYAPDHKLHN